MRRSLSIGSAMLLACALLISACGTLNPFAAASGVDEKAYAVLGAYGVFQKQALKVVQDGTLPNGVRRAAADADALAFPVLKSLDQALTTYLEIRDQLAAGTSDKEKLAIAIANLKTWTEKGDAAVKAMRDALPRPKPKTALRIVPQPALGRA